MFDFKYVNLQIDLKSSIIRLTINVYILTRYSQENGGKDMNKVIAAILMMVSTIMICLMWLSSKFIPVYVNGEYVLANQIVRYILYLVFFGMALYGFAYLASDKEKKNRRRRRR